MYIHIKMKKTWELMNTPYRYSKIWKVINNHNITITAYCCEDDLHNIDNICNIVNNYNDIDQSAIRYYDYYRNVMSVFITLRMKYPDLIKARITKKKFITFLHFGSFILSQMNSNPEEVVGTSIADINIYQQLKLLFLGEDVEANAAKALHNWIILYKGG